MGLVRTPGESAEALDRASVVETPLPAAPLMNAAPSAHARRARDDLRPLGGVEGRRREAAPPGTVRIGTGFSRPRAVAVRPRPVGMFFADPAFRAVTRDGRTEHAHGRNRA